MSVLVESSSWSDADLQAYIRANVGAATGVYGNSSASSTTVTSAGGFKLA
jgi:hypothetical protein